MIKSIIGSSLSRNARAGVIGAASVAGGLYTYSNNKYRYGHEYGNGTAAIAAAASVMSFGVGIATTIATFGYDHVNSLYNKQRNIKKNSWTKTNFNQTKQTNDMRLLSIQSLSRAHNSRQRVLGNEAFYMFR